MTDLTIALVNYNFKEDILAALTTIFDDLKECPYKVEVVVVDNSQNVDALGKAMNQKFPRAHYIMSKTNVGFGQGNSLGFKAYPARYYACFNRDILIPENSKTIERLIKYLDEHPKIGAIGPKVVNFDGSLQYSCYRFDLASILVKPLKQINWDEKYKWVKKYTDRLLMKDFDHNSTRPVDWVLGAALVVRAEVVAAVGWFDERYFMYLEDCDWCHTMWEHGFPVYYVHDIIIKHRHDRGSAQVPGLFKAFFKNKLARFHAVSWVKYIWKWRHSFKYYKP